jgi:hypothetical protein
MRGVAMPWAPELQFVPGSSDGGIFQYLLTAVLSVFSTNRTHQYRERKSVVRAKWVLPVPWQQQAWLLRSAVTISRLSTQPRSATVFADDNKKYLSTDLTQVEPARPDYLAPEVTLTGISVLGRVCSFCERGQD